jgi:hypothetical protein
LWLLLGPLAFNFVAAALHRYPYGTSPRIALYMAPAFCMLIGLGLAASVKTLWTRRLVPLGYLLVAGALGLIPIAGIAIDFAKPYHTADDRVHRQIACRLAKQVVPGDRWLVFNGVGHLEPSKTLMMSKWIQQEAELRFYLSKDAPCSIRWIDHPSQVSANHAGRTALIIHHSGAPEFADRPLALILQDLIAQTGRAHHQHFELGLREFIDVYTFPTAPPSEVRPAFGSPQPYRSPFSPL